METIKFKTALLSTFAMISEPGKYKVQVLNNVSEKNLYTENGRSRYIVNLKAIAADKKAEVFETFSGKGEVEIDETNGLFLTASIWKNGEETPALPMKSEIVTVNVGLVADRDGVEVLRVTNIQVAAAKTASKFSLEPAAIMADGTLEHA